MGKVERNRWIANEKCREIISQPIEKLVACDIDYLKKNYTSYGGLVPSGYHGGAFYTPPHVARFIVKALGIKAGDRVLEPSCGAGAFFEYLPEGVEVTGIERERTAFKVASYIYPEHRIICGDAFNHMVEDEYDFVIGNPPFGETVKLEGPTDLKMLKYNRKKNESHGRSQWAFLELAIRAAKPGGYIALILPANLGSINSYQPVQNLIKETCWIDSVIELPSETFLHVGTRVTTNIVILRKVPITAQKVWIRYGANGNYPADPMEPNAVWWWEGQTQVLHAKVTDIGWDRRGHSTNDGDGQLDELLELYTDNWLVRDNLYAEQQEPNPENVFSINPNLSRLVHERSNIKNRRLAYWQVTTLNSSGYFRDEGTDRDWQEDIVQNYRQNGDHQVVRSTDGKQGQLVMMI